MADCMAESGGLYSQSFFALSESISQVVRNNHNNDTYHTRGDESRDHGAIWHWQPPDLHTILVLHWMEQHSAAKVCGELHRSQKNKPSS